MKNSFFKIFARGLVVISICGYMIFHAQANPRLNPTANSSSSSPAVSGPGPNSSTLPTTRKDGAREKVVLAGDTWCPFNCQPNSGKEGVLVEIARKAFEKNNIDVVYVVKPWVEAMSDLVLGKIDGILGASATEIQDCILPSIEQANTKIATFTLKESPWIYDGVVTLKNKPLGVVEGYTYPDDIKTYINSNYLTSPEYFVYAISDDPLKENIDNLLNKKTELYIEDENVFTYYSDLKNVNGIKNSGYVNSSPVKIFIAFHKTNPRANDLAKMITDLTFEYKANGNLSKIYSKYNLKEY